MNHPKIKLIVAVTGASGAIYAKVLFDSLMKCQKKQYHDSIRNKSVIFAI